MATGPQHIVYPYYIPVVQPEFFNYGNLIFHSMHVIERVLFYSLSDFLHIPT